MNTVDFPKAFDPHALEQQTYEEWETRGYFAAAGGGQPYCIMIPPPNVTGSLHMGHAFQCTLMDTLIRYHRMSGDKTLWQVGSDHAGIATQMVVERQLNAKGVSRTDLNRDEFIDRVWDWKQHSGGTIQRQLRRLGSSVDWTREKFTMDDELSFAVEEVFIELYKKGLIYRGKRLVNWDPVLLTAISDLEVISEEEDGYLWHFRYPIHDSDEYLVIATTRPETMLGDTAVAVHPEDSRFTHLVGKTADLPLTGRQIPIIADHYVDPEFGTGCVKITPGHDFNDFQVGARANLDIINIMTPQAQIDLPGTPYHGLDRFEARKKVVADLESLDLLEKIEGHKYMVPRGDRTDSVIEPYLTDQWFVRVEPLAKAAIEVVKSGEIKFVPANWERTYFDWMENIEDWCISRQIWWGHRIPAWYDDSGNIFVARSEEEARDQARQLHGSDDFVLSQDEDVLDTWFSSALWPFSTLGWPKPTEEMKTFYPTNVLITGFDIIFFWVARMIMFGLEFADDIPFHEVYIHGLVRDSEGQKMSKSKGNILDPLDLIDGVDLETLVKKRTTGLMQPELAPKIEKFTRAQYPDGIPSYGSDALRFTFASLATQGRDVRFDLGRIEGYKNFCNKIWNAARFVLMNTSTATTGSVTDWTRLQSHEKWILTELTATANRVEEAFKLYRFDIAAKHLYQFIWNEFCDWYIEFAKVKLRSEALSDDNRDEVRRVLAFALDSLLRLLHPIMPFITEKIWSSIPSDLRANGDNSSIMLQTYSSHLPVISDAKVGSEIDWVKSVVSGVRNIRGELNIKPEVRLNVFYQNSTDEVNGLVDDHHAYIKALAGINQLEEDTDFATPADTPSFYVGDLKVLVALDVSANTEELVQRIKKDIVAAQKQIKISSSKLSNSQFLAKAPANIVSREREKMDEAQNLLDKLETQLQHFSSP